MHYKRIILIGLCAIGVSLPLQAVGVTPVKPDTQRYSAPRSAESNRSYVDYYQRYRQPYLDASHNNSMLQKRTEVDRIDRDVIRERNQLELDRQRIQQRRIMTDDPAEAATLRSMEERRQQAFDQWKKNMDDRRTSVEQRKHMPN